MNIVWEYFVYLVENRWEYSKCLEYASSQLSKISKYGGYGYLSTSLRMSESQGGNI